MACTYTTILLFVCVMQFFTIIYLLSSYFPVDDDRSEMSDDLREEIPTPDIVTSGRGEFSSSVFCVGESKRNRECRFQNLCYNKISNNYLFFHGPKTFIYGLPRNRKEPALVDLSSVDDHSAKYFYYSDVLSNHYSKYNDTYFVRGRSILFHRFNPENIMHVIHDDLIPIFHTKRNNFPNTNDINFVMMDGRQEGPYFDLYKLFSNRIFMIQNFTTTLTCFEDTIVGLSKTTTWYQYGFKVPQGPIEKLNYPYTELIYFSDIFKEKLVEHYGPIINQNDDTSIESEFIVVFSRSTTRRILNEGQLVFKLSTHFKMPVRIIQLESDSIVEIVSLLSRAFMVIGIHGAHLVTSLFMKPLSILIEIFPFAVPSARYTPFKTLAELLSIPYIAWENHIEENSFTHPNRSSDLGGIAHLPKTLQQKIIDTKLVPVHLCCKDPFWLFRIYQDTIIDLNRFIHELDGQLSISNNTLKNDGVVQMNNIESRHKIFMYPALVDNITCKRQAKVLNLSWNVPWNMVSQRNMKYHLFVLSTYKNCTVENSYEVSETEFSIVTEDKNHLFTIWICAIFNHNMGKFSAEIKC